MSPSPWNREKRASMTRKINKEAKRAASRLGASMVTIIAWFPAGEEHLHMLDGGDAPMPRDQVYKQMVSIGAVLDESGGEDVALS